MNILTHNGTITIKSPTGEHRVFKVETQHEKSKFAPGQRVLSVRDGFKWKGFAFVISKEGNKSGEVIVWKRYLSEGNKTTEQLYVDVLLNEDTWTKLGYQYKKEGRCRICNRPLNDPESIDKGIGPVCEKMLGLNR